MPVRNFRGYYSAFGSALEELYRDEHLTLAAGENEPEFEYDSEVFARAAEWIREQGKFTPSMLRQKPARAVINETLRVLSSAVSSSITQEVPEELVAALENNAFIFSGFKTFHSLSEVGLSLTTDDGKVKPYAEFQRDVEKIDDTYNSNYLRAEYNQAVASSQMAVKWQEFQHDGDRYNLQYRTAADEKVRAEHAALQDITLAVDDPFWDEFMPPNGWNCRCTVVQVRKSKYEASDSEHAIEVGREITSAPKQQMFRFNPGKQMKLFPDKHPYNKAPEPAKKVVTELAERHATPIKTRQDLEDEMKNIAGETDWFARGFNQMLVTTKKGVNGSTDMNGVIFLTGSKMKACISGIDKMRRGDKPDRKEADALSTLWHEINHNRNKQGNKVMSRDQTLLMEMANEYVSRQTLPEFYEQFGCEVSHREFMTNRDSTGYNRMVCTYQKLIELTQSDNAKVVQDVQKHLFEGEYTDQLTGLVDAISNNQSFTKSNGKKLTKQEVTRLVKECQRTTEDGIKRTFDVLTR